MISRYTLPEMGRIWSEENKLQCWLRVEVAAAEAMAGLGLRYNSGSSTHAYMDDISCSCRLPHHRLHPWPVASLPPKTAKPVHQLRLRLARQHVGAVFGVWGWGDCGMTRPYNRLNTIPA